MDENDVPTSAQVEEFLRITNEPANTPVFVHCAGGRHRTGALTAVYRMRHDAWTAAQAFDEMKRYEFLKEGDHLALKNFVFDYYSGLEHKSATSETSAGNK